MKVELVIWSIWGQHSCHWPNWYTILQCTPMAILKSLKSFVFISQSKYIPACLNFCTGLVASSPGNLSSYWNLASWLQGCLEVSFSPVVGFKVRKEGWERRGVLSCSVPFVSALYRSLYPVSFLPLSTHSLWLPSLCPCFPDTGVCLGVHLNGKVKGYPPPPPTAVHLNGILSLSCTPSLLPIWVSVQLVMVLASCVYGNVAGDPVSWEVVIRLSIHKCVHSHEMKPSLSMLGCCQ